MSDDRPLNIWSKSDEDIGRLMSHFAHTPFELDGVTFGSHACPKNKPEYIDYHGCKFKPSSPEHRDLIMRANRAKLDAHPGIACAFVATLPRPIVHILPGKEDDPHDVFCEIMRKLRDEYAQRRGDSAVPNGIR